MLMKFSVVLVFLQLHLIKAEKVNWDLAIVVNNEIQLLSSDGSRLDSRKPFISLTAIAYDGIRDQFIVNDRDTKNDTIFTVRISNKTATEPIIKGPRGYVQGLAIDTLKDILYWTNEDHTIHYTNLNDATHNFSEFVVFKNTIPHAIAIDVCNRDMYYSTNIDSKPTIERIKLDYSEHQIMVNVNDTTTMNDKIQTPVGLVIDYKDQRLYWADSRIGSTAGRIESIGLDGSDRRLVVERNTMQPYGITIDEEAIYWTDTNNKALYKFLKSETNPHANPELLVKFDELPMGLVSNYYMKEDCQNLSAAVKEYKESRKDTLKPTTANPLAKFLKCFNGGTIKEGDCDCKRGFRGDNCEISICSTDFCLNGDCYLSSSGKPMCRCNKGFLGDRCEKYKCDSYCLNEGECIITSEKDIPQCSCLEGFLGNRCEYNEQICDLYCSDRESSGFSDQFEVMCRCSYLYADRNASSIVKAPLQAQPDLLSKFQDPVVYLSAIILFCLLVIIALFCYIHIIQKRRPRIKKRIIVNKNVTPLTYRPQPNTEQCEITIENCCNMNICETPCFEPTREDKKNLLTNMEGEDLY